MIARACWDLSFSIEEREKRSERENSRELAPSKKSSRERRRNDGREVLKSEIGHLGLEVRTREREF